MSVEASYYDGQSARRHPVVLQMLSGRLVLRGADVARDLVTGEFSVPGRLGNTPRLILFHDGARCEVADHHGFERLFSEAGFSNALIGHLESRWTFAIAALILTLSLVAATYVWGLPYAAEKVAARVPERVLTLIDTQFMQTFDGRLFEPSGLSKERQQVLAGRLRKLLPAVQGQEQDRTPQTILFRSSPAIGPNAFALPGGTIVILDEIVALTNDDDEILAVLAHEMGHVAERHALRQMLQASAVGLATSWYVGDVSTLLAAAPAALLETRYSRDFERRADAFGADLLAANHISPHRLADMLEKLERAHRGSPRKQQDDTMDYFSTHPNTEERIRTLRGRP